MTLAADHQLYLSPAGHWIGYSMTDGAQALAAEISGGQPVAQFPLLRQGYTSFVWLHKMPQDFLAFAESNAELFNLPASNPYFILTTGSFSQSLNPVEDILLSNDLSQISLLDVTIMTPVSTIDVKLERPQVVWSPDGQFISLLNEEQASCGQYELVQVNERRALRSTLPDAAPAWRPRLKVSI